MHTANSISLLFESFVFPVLSDVAVWKGNRKRERRNEESHRTTTVTYSCQITVSGNLYDERYVSLGFRGLLEGDRRYPVTWKIHWWLSHAGMFSPGDIHNTFRFLRNYILILTPSPKLKDKIQKISAESNYSAHLGI